MAPPESRLSRKVLRYLSSLSPEVWAFKVHGSNMQLSGIPDIMGVSKGLAFGIELKVGKNQPSPIQKLRIRELREAGALVSLAFSLEEVADLMEDLSLFHNPDRPHECLWRKNPLDVPKVAEFIRAKSYGPHMGQEKRIRLSSENRSN